MSKSSMEEETDEEWLADYLRLEYGEDSEDPDSVKASDLKFIGEFVIDGINTKYWSYPTSNELMWATISENGDSVCASMTDIGPPSGKLSKNS